MTDTATTTTPPNTTTEDEPRRARVKPRSIPYVIPCPYKREDGHCPIHGRGGCAGEEEVK